jgi:hypothetical protein
MAIYVHKISLLCLIKSVISTKLHPVPSILTEFTAEDIKRKHKSLFCLWLRRFQSHRMLFNALLQLDT